MPFCPNCGKEVLATDKFCLNCGNTLDRTVPAPSVGPATASAPPTIRPASEVPGMKNPWLAALLNFFLPGLGYVYVGIGHDTGELIFGALVFLFYFVGWEVAFASIFLSGNPSSASTSASSPLAALIALVFLLPFAFAYDGYRRAS